MNKFIEKVELGGQYNQRAIEKKGTPEEVKILQEAVSKNVETPYTYDRLSIILSKAGKMKEALEVCKKYEKIMNKRREFRRKKGYGEDISPREKAIIKRLKRTEEY